MLHECPAIRLSPLFVHPPDIDFSPNFNDIERVSPTSHPCTGIVTCTTSRQPCREDRGMPLPQEPKAFTSPRSVLLLRPANGLVGSWLISIKERS